MGELSVSSAAWGSLTLALFVATFGPSAGFYFILYMVFFLAGSLGVIFIYGKLNSEKLLESYEQTVLPSVLPAIKAVAAEIRQENKPGKGDRRLTGASIIDEPLQQVLQYVLRDYVHCWYYDLSDDEGFLLEVRQIMQMALTTLFNRCKDVEWQPYLTTRLVDDFASHLRAYRKALRKVNEHDVAEAQQSDDADEIVEAFFNAEVEMEKEICRDLVCTSEQEEREFLRDLSDVLLFLLLPSNDFQSRSMRCVLREIFVMGILLPTVDTLSDPDYINQYVTWMLGDSPCTCEAFLTVLKGSELLDELEAVREKASEELQRLRSQDTIGDDVTVKGQMNSLQFVKKLCEVRMDRLRCGKEQELECSRLPANLGKLCVIPLDDILGNNIALQYFIDYMQSMAAQALLFFWLIVEGYRVTAEQQLDALHTRERVGAPRHAPPTHNLVVMLRNAAIGVYEQYLGEKASPRVRVEDLMLANLREKLHREDLPPNLFPALFDDIQRKVYDTMLRDDRYYPGFKQSSFYVKALAELDMLKEPSIREGDDSESYNGSPASSLNVSLDDLSLTAQTPSPEEPGQLQAQITETGVGNEHGKSYTLYAITVMRRHHDGSQDSWDTFRRYSDFNDLHMRITEQFENLANSLKMPGKKTFKNMEKEFLERRKKELNKYLQEILNAEVIKAHPGLSTIVFVFLENKPYNRGKGDFARKMDTLVNPLRNSVRNVSNAVRAFPDNFVEGMTRVSDNMGRMSDKLNNEFKIFSSKVPTLLPRNTRPTVLDDCRVSAQLDENADDNLPLRIMLLLMDEVFDLKDRNQWLRRNIKNLLQQFIRATFGDMINRKIVDHVDLMTSPEQVAEYVKRFRDSLWPGGILAETPPPRNLHTHMRTRVAAQAKMLSSMPDELKHILGAETMRKGLLRVFEMFQHRQLNRRLLYVCLEGLLESLYPKNRLHQLFLRLHSRSPRLQAFHGRSPTGSAKGVSVRR
ncbi:sorting nexin-13 [Lampetra fluviatilis]